MRKIKKMLISLLVLSSLTILEGCKRENLYETTSSLEKAGQYTQAIQLYQNYLRQYPTSTLTSEIYYRIAKDCEQNSDYLGALSWYEKIISEYPESNENLQALLNEADLYRDRLKNNLKAVDYSQRALEHYFENVQVKADVQFLVEAQYQSANALFSQKNFKQANQVATSVFESFPSLFINPDTRAKVEGLVDRTQRVEEVAQADSSAVSLRNETPFNKSFDTDFESNTSTASDKIYSPSGTWVVSRKKWSNSYYLYLAKVAPKSDKLIFKIIPHTSGANLPDWSPDEQCLVYLRANGSIRRLDKLDLRLYKSQNLFHSNDASLGLYPAYHPSGTKIAFVYGGNVWLVNADGTDKSLLKTNQKLDYTAQLKWSIDGTMIRCRENSKNGNSIDDLLILDVSKSSIP